MPKRKRVESVSNWCLGIESDCELMDKQNDEDFKAIIHSKLFNTLDNNKETAIESHIQNSIQCETIANNNTNINIKTNIKDNIKTNLKTNVKDNNNDINCCKLRRKSNRISKPIQRSLDTSPNQNITIKKIVKQNNQISNVNNCETEKPIVKTRTDETNKSSSSKGKSLRKLQMWTEEDTKCFFEALSEHGKDFPRIQSYMAQRYEKKGIPQDSIKNYEQVRHYYYRMWHKIANSLNISDVVDKGTQEVYGLVNYGEIWKKFGSKFDSKLGIHLQQLVNFGHTIFKVKGKNVRVKTPVCNALKKIHKINVSEKSKPSNVQSLLNLPKEVVIELHPATNESWIRVHSLSQNPRVRTKMSLQKRLSTLIEYLEKRWNQSRIRDSECRTLCGTSLPNAPLIEDSCLRLRPHISGDLNNVSLSKSFLNSQPIDLSLTAYLKNLYKDELKGSDKKTKGVKAKDKSNDESIADGSIKSPNNEQNNELIIDNCDPNDDIKAKSDSAFKSDEEEPIAEAERSLSLLKMLASMNASQNEMSEEIHATDEDEDDVNKDEEERDAEVPSPESNANVCLPEPPANATLAQWLSAKDDDHDVDDGFVEDDKKAQNAIESNDQMSQLSAERARKGWSLSETGSVTIGELYLLFRCPKKILLEYLWEPILENGSNPEEDSNIKSNEELNSKEETNTDVLKKLLIAANVSLMNIKKPSHSITQTQKKKRIKPTPAPVVANDGNSSQLLSSVISKTIFNDNNDLHNKNEKNSSEMSPNMNESESHNFIVPTSPAPKAVNKTKSRAICGDPALIQEALRQLQSNKYTRRQRRPTPKPVFAHNKPLLPRGSPIATLSSQGSASTSVSPPSAQTQPIFMIPSRPLHINAITSVTTHSSSTTLSPSVLSRTVPSVPMVANVNMTAINSNSLRTSLRHSIKTHNNSESFDVILPQKAPQSDTNTQTNVVNSFIKSINSSNIPLIENMTHLLEPISQVAVPIVGQSMPTLQHLQTVSSTFSIAESAPIICSQTDRTLSQINKSDNKMNDNTDDEDITSMTSIEDNRAINEVLENNANANITSPNKLPLLSSSPTISSLLEISLPEPPFSENSCSSLTDAYHIEKRPFERLTLPDISCNTISKSTNNSNDPTLPTSSTSCSSLASPPIDRHKLSRSPVPDSQWLNGESCDLSIGTLLNACESPIKTVPNSSNSLNNDVDTQMSCLATDNSVDLMAKFADLAAQIVDSNSKST